MDVELKPPKRPAGRLLSSMILVVCGGVIGACIASAAFLAAWPTNTGATTPSREARSRICQALCAQSGLGPQCASACDLSLVNATRPGALGSWINFDDAIQHIGITVSNVSRSVDFYTGIMGGVEVAVAGNSNVQDTSLYHLLMGSALGLNVTQPFAANISTGGPQFLDVRYVAFDQLVLELLDYRSDEAKLQRRLDKEVYVYGPGGLAGGDIFPQWSQSTVPPSVVHNMHIAFHVRPEYNLDDFVVALETKAQAAGFSNVLCDRTVPLPRTADGKLDVGGVPKRYNAIHQTTGNFPGWSLAYCKGPDGEQLEFNTVTGVAAHWMAQAHEAYYNLTTNPIW